MEQEPLTQEEMDANQAIVERLLDEVLSDKQDSEEAKHEKAPL